MALKVSEFSLICRNYECTLILSDLCIRAKRLFLMLQKHIFNVPTRNK